MKGKTLLKKVDEIAKTEGFKDEIMILVARKDGGIVAKRLTPPNVKQNNFLSEVFDYLSGR